MFKNKSRRIYLSGYFYFITVKTQFNTPVFKNQRLVKIFGDSLNFLKQRGDFELVAGVLLPDHFHLLLKPEKKNISQIIHDLKSYTANQVNKYFSDIKYRRGRDASPEVGFVGFGEIIKSKNFSSIKRPGLRAWPFVKIWQRSFYYHIINSEKDFINHYNYIYYNPLKHGYVNNPNNWLGLWIGNEFYYWI